MPRVLAALAFLVLLLAGCGETRDAVAPEPAAPEGPHVARLGKPTGSERLYVNTVGEWVLGCTGPLRDYAGEPPSRRMAVLARQASAACAGEGEVDAVLTRIAGYELYWGDAQALPVRGGRSRASRIEPRLSAAALELTGRATEVRCWSDEDWRAVASAGSPYDDADGGAAEIAGFASDDARVHLSPSVCGDLVDLVYGDEGDADENVAFAVAVLAHEARHRMGEQREDQTECWAVQNVERTAVLLGVDAELAQSLAELYWEELYPEEEPPYWSDECRDGGALDLRPDSSEWP